MDYNELIKLIGLIRFNQLIGCLSVGGDDSTIIKLKIYVTCQPSFMVFAISPELDFYLRILILENIVIFHDIFTKTVDNIER